MLSEHTKPQKLEIHELTTNELSVNGMQDMLGNKERAAAPVDMHQAVLKNISSILLKNEYTLRYTRVSLSFL